MNSSDLLTTANSFFCTVKRTELLTRHLKRVQIHEMLKNGLAKLNRSITEPFIKARAREIIHDHVYQLKRPLSLKSFA